MTKRILAVAVLLFVLPVAAFAAGHTIVLTWNQSGDPVALNCIARSATAGGEDFKNPLFCSTTPIVTYTDAAVAVGDVWYYKVDAVDSKGHASVGSNETGPDTVTPLPPQNLQSNVN